MTSGTPITINPPTLPAPTGFSHAVLAGNTLHLAGQTALDENSEIVEGGIVPQFRQAVSNLLAPLSYVGGAPEHLVSLTFHLTDVAAYQAHGPQIGKAWRKLLGPVFPALTVVGTPGLWQPEALLEISGVAVIPDAQLRVPA